MLEFYKKALVAVLGLLVASAVLAYLCLERAFLQAALLPAAAREYPWQELPETDANRGGLSTVTLHDARYSLDVELFLSSAVEPPQAALSLVFQGRDGKPTLIDRKSVV